MALDLQGLFVNPATIRDERLEGIAQQRRQLAQMGGSMSGLLGQVAGGGAILGEQLAEGIARGMGLETTKESEAKAMNKVLKTLDTTSPKSLRETAKKLQDKRPDIANQMRAQALAITVGASEKALENLYREREMLVKEQNSLSQARQAGAAEGKLALAEKELEERIRLNTANINNNKARIDLDTAKHNLDVQVADDNRYTNYQELINDRYKEFTAESIAANALNPEVPLVPRAKSYEPSAMEKDLINTGLIPGTDEFKAKANEWVDAKIQGTKGSPTKYTDATLKGVQAMFEADGETKALLDQAEANNPDVKPDDVRRGVAAAAMREINLFIAENPGVRPDYVGIARRVAQEFGQSGDPAGNVTR